MLKVAADLVAVVGLGFGIYFLVVILLTVVAAAARLRGR
jgi:hypothetical protein